MHPAAAIPQAPAAANFAEAADWSAWRGAGDVEARARLFERHVDFARMLAARCYRHRFVRELEFGDYAQFAMIGLLEAIDRFDPARGVPFEAYAALRINGAVINGVESLDERQQQIATRQAMRRDRARSLSATEGAAASADPLERLAEVAIGLALGLMLEGTGMYLDGEQVDPGPTPYARLEMAQLRARAALLVDYLPDVERQVIRHHYFQQVPFNAIAQALGVTNGRVSQIHHAALQRLRDWSSVADECVLIG